MNARTLVTVVLGIPFAIYSLWVSATLGPIAIFEVALAGPAPAQVFADVVVSLMLLLTFIREDCQRRGATFWPWFVGTLATGSLAPLVYFGQRALEARRGDQA